MYCGKPLEDGARFCTNCGKPVDEELYNEGAEQAPEAGAVSDEAAPTTVLETGEGAADGHQGENGAETPADAAPSDAFAASNDSAAFMPASDQTVPYAEAPDQTVQMPQVGAQAPSGGTGWQQPAPAQQQPKRRNPALIACIVVLVVAIVAGGTAATLYALGVGPFATVEKQEDSGNGSDDSARGDSNEKEDGADEDSAEEDEVTSVSVPNVTGMDSVDAVVQLQSMGLEVGDTSQDYSSTVDVGKIISQSPAGGAAAEKGDKVDLMISRGPKETHVEHRYTLVRQAMTWSDAESYCESNGGYLASITSQDEWNQVLGILPSSGLTVCWIGGFGSGGSWYWANGDSFSYTRWASGEPNNDGGNEGRIAMLKSNGSWGWYDVPNDVSDVYSASKMGFIMEQEVEVQ